MELYKRENYLKKIRGFYHSDDLIKVITGVRRCGKSSLMQTISDELALAGVKEENIIYIDLERRGYRSIKNADELDELIAKYSSIEGMKYLFIDEVQNVRGFEEVLNGFRSEGGWSIFITGSNSYLLSGELVTKLTGRYLEFEMFPLTFEEYLQMKKFYHIAVSDNLLEELNSYITEGGFPRTLFLKDKADKRTYVQGVIKEIFQKDIKKRVKIRDIESFEAVQNFIINNFGAVISINRLCENLRKNGMTITKATVSRYVKVLTDAKILYECSRFDLKSRKSLSGEKKYYLADLSFYFLRNTDNRINFGPTLENMVFVYARAHDYSVSIGKIGKLECDFILRNVDNQYSYVQVAYTIALSKDTEDREYRPLEQIRDNYPKYVATTDFLLQQRNGIHHINLVDFMKEGKDF
ncbi:MAG: ATP-binding protein [Roseburia sp.]|nr:ATP-binding protein [Roseburia sp.]MCM1243659.1 ATP-binding protein [Roseburia sp.]